MIAQIPGPLQMLEDDVQDFMTNAVFHLLYRKRQKDKRIEVHDVLGILKGHGCSRADVEADFFSHLEKEVAVKIILRIDELQAYLTDKGKKLFYKIIRQGGSTLFFFFQAHVIVCPDI